MSALCVLDTDVLIGALDAGDAHHRPASRLILGLIDRDVALLISVVNYAETLVRPSETDDRLAQAERAIRTLGIELVAPTPAMGRDAARLRRGISLADGFALATARALGATVATFDVRVLRALKPAGLQRARVPRRPA